MERGSIIQRRKNSEKNFQSSLNDKKQTPFMKTLSDYASASVIHGVAYINPSGNTAGERIIWFILVALAFAFASHEVRILYQRWQENPVITVLDTVTLPIEEIEFPAVTICPQGSSKDIMNAALFEQFKNFVFDKTENLTNFEESKISRKREVDESQLYNLSTSNVENLLELFLVEVYGSNKIRPMELIQLLASKEPDSIVENKAIWITEETQDCNGSSYEMIIDTLNRQANPKCPDGFDELDDQICIHVGEEVETHAEAEFYCEEIGFGSANLLTLETTEQFNALKQIILKDHITRRKRSSAANCSDDGKCKQFQEFRYEHIPRACVLNHNLELISERSLEECKIECNKRTRCLAFEYGVPHGGSSPRYKARDCHLQKGTDSSDCDGVHFNVDLYVKKSCRFIGKKNYIATDEGNDVRGTTGESLKDCEKLCKQTNGCNSFTYCHTQKICNVKDKLKIGTRKENNSCTTFYNSCGMASPIWKGPTTKVWESSIEPNVGFISQTGFQFPYSLDECKEYCQQRNAENRCNAIEYNSVNETCALLSFPYAIPNPDQAFNDTYIQMVSQENWNGYYLVKDDFIPQAVRRRCEDLPDSPNPGFEKGCRGAVNLKGNPSRQYCTNDDKPEYRFRWFEKCCKYENDNCVPKTAEKDLSLDCGFPKEFQLRDHSGNVFCANANGDLKGHYGAINSCDNDYKQTDKHKFYAISSMDDIIIPFGVCAIKSKYGNRYLEMDFRGSEVRVSNDDSLNSKKYFKAEKTVTSDGTEKMKIFNIQPSTNLTLRKIAATLYTKVIDDFTLCGNECLFSITDLTIDKSATNPTIMPSIDNTTTRSEQMEPVLYIWLRSNYDSNDKTTANVDAGNDNESKYKCHVISKDAKPSSTDCTRKAKPVCMIEKSTIYPNQIIPKFQFVSQLEACKNGNDTGTRNLPSRKKRDDEKANTITTEYSEEVKPSISENLEEIKRLENVEKFEAALKPALMEAREKKRNEDIEAYNEIFKSLDMRIIYDSLFDLLWYSMMPCFDVKGLTSTFRDEMSIIKRCYWKGKAISCSAIFKKYPTDRGVCCAFNMKNAENVFIESRYTKMMSKKQTEEKKRSFDDSSIPNWYKNTNEPISNSGSARGLKLILDRHTDKLSSMSVQDNFRGFIGIVDWSDKYPMTQLNELRINPGMENDIKIVATNLKTVDETRKISPMKRNCYFFDEYKLKLHQKYSQANCVFECRVNFVYECSKQASYDGKNFDCHEKSVSESKFRNESVGCIPWFYPTFESKTSKMCNPWETKTFQNMMNSHVPNKKCKHCLPDCNITKYDSTISYSKLPKCDHSEIGSNELCDLVSNNINPPRWSDLATKTYQKANVDPPTYVVNNSTRLTNKRYSYRLNRDELEEYDAFEEDIAVLNVFFGNSFGTQYKTVLRMTNIEFLSLVGGNVGLAMGISLLSIVELIYWFTVKLFFNHWNNNSYEN